jgi:hypothetical protein
MLTLGPEGFVAEAAALRAVATRREKDDEG